MLSNPWDLSFFQNRMGEAGHAWVGGFQVGHGGGVLGCATGVGADGCQVELVGFVGAWQAYGLELQVADTPPLPLKLLPRFRAQGSFDVGGDGRPLDHAFGFAAP